MTKKPTQKTTKWLKQKIEQAKRERKKLDKLLASRLRIVLGEKLAKTDAKVKEKLEVIASQKKGC
jgi:hypothetical protein